MLHKVDLDLLSRKKHGDLSWSLLLLTEYSEKCAFFIHLNELNEKQRKKSRQGVTLVEARSDA